MRKDIIEKKERILFLINKKVPKVYMCREFNCQESTLNNWLIKLGIKYEGNQGLRGWDKKRTPASIYLTLNGIIIQPRELKKKLLYEKIKDHRCEKCNNTEWNNEKIPLELHHIDGNKHNNKIENLELLCPNCHAQTPNFSGRNKHKN